jgi:hypothetical protein
MPASMTGAARFSAVRRGDRIGRRNSGTLLEGLAHLPPNLADAAKQALPAALEIARRLGPNGAALTSQARSAFVDGLGLAMLIAAGSAVLAAAIVAWRAPGEIVTTPGGREAAPGGGQDDADGSAHRSRPPSMEAHDASRTLAHAAGGEHEPGRTALEDQDLDLSVSTSARSFAAATGSSQTSGLSATSSASAMRCS